MNAKSFAKLHQTQVRSGLSIAAFCRNRGVPLSSFHYWRRRHTSASAGDEFLEVQLTEPALAPPSSLPALPVSAQPPIGLLYRGASLSLPVGFSQTTLRQCLEVLRETLPC